MLAKRRQIRASVIITRDVGHEKNPHAGFPEAEIKLHILTVYQFLIEEADFFEYFLLVT
jgi:hypothetical protein